MPVITFDGLLISPIILFLAIAAILTITTNLAIPKIIHDYIDLKLSWFNLALFICYIGLSMLLIGN